MIEHKVLRMDNIGIVVEDLKATIAFFTEIGMELEAEMPVEGQWVDRIVGLKDVRNDIAMMKTPNGHGKLELMKFNSPKPTIKVDNAQLNTLGIRRIMFNVTNLDDVAVRLRKLGAKPLGDVVEFKDMNGAGYRLYYLCGPEGIMVALAEDIDKKPAKDVKEKSSLVRMDNVLIVVDDLKTSSEFYKVLGLVFDGEATVEDPSVGKLIGLKDVKATLSLMHTPDGHSRIEFDKFHSPKANGPAADQLPVNTPGIRRLMFAVDNIDEAVKSLQAHGGTLMGEVVNYEDLYRLCYMRGPEGIIIALAQQLFK
jgi:catechol 2,3-dioxygenase-like lactoylglutathione lyase family enzyme